MKNKKWWRLLLLSAVLALTLSGCVAGTSYLAFSYTTVSPPSNFYFEEFPAGFYYDTYYEHPEGTYYGEYTNGYFFSFTYTIEANAGFLSPGNNRYYTMYLDPSGPDLYYFNSSAALRGKTGKGSAKGEVTNAPIDTSPYDMAHPEPFSYEKSFPGGIFRITGNKYKLK
jgi:hypothetical protein